MASKKLRDGVNMEEVRKGAESGRVTMVIEGVAYDFTDFADEHPGGPDYLKKNAGKDATAEFVASHPVDIIERTLSRDQFKTMPIGNIDASTVKPEDVAKVDAKSHDALPDTSGQMPVK